MGNTWEVSVWRKGSAEWDYVRIYAGESLQDAIIAMARAKADGAACVKLEWR